MEAGKEWGEEVVEERVPEVGLERHMNHQLTERVAGMGIALPRLR